MTNWLLGQLLPLSLLLVLLLLLRPLVLRLLGARWQYSLWALLPALLVVSLLPLPAYKAADNSISRFQIGISKLNADISENLYAIDGLMLVWLTGVLCLALLLFVQQRQIWAQLAVATPLVNSADIPLRCKQSDGQHGPYVTGLWRPQLLLPNDFAERFSKEQQQLILQHELTHVQRGDLHANGLALLLLTLFWFHPLCWWAYRLYRQDQELACDAVVLQHANAKQKIAYSHALLSNAETAAKNWQLLTNPYGDKHMMKQRLTLLQQQHGFSKPLLSLSLVVFTAVLLLLQQPVLAGSGDNAAPISRVEPRYPLEAAQNKIEGYVVAQFDISAEGKVQNVKILKSVPAQVFDKESVRALEQWTYAKTMAGQQGVKVQLDFAMDPVDYNIERVEVSPSK
ncbi:M56 family metallopeptidase [Rheinheimera sp. 4Y26]|uniref:M56 family metallopeptidase n=1 Tax=Rheinheimera sp. 4Y26 TaxID=2977811 RepID=UPI0021B0B738|nr:M56 family metallopeptidase [Rheinheimera sp. 4Y26]MCT6700473.1 M56 family metallopeptidase [Rheinheimera sp. 4Y26]